LSRGGAISSPASLPNNVLHSSGSLADSLGWKWTSYKAEQASGRQSLCVHLCLACPSLPRCLQLLSFCGSLHCIIVGEVADTLRWREICAGGWQSEVLYPHVLCQVQVPITTFLTLFSTIRQIWDFWLS
jgi:hypothetical protein